jgi:Tol biopolymer transport system component
MASLGATGHSAESIGADPSQIVFASMGLRLGDHLDVISVDRRGVPRRVRDLGPAREAVLSADGRSIAYLVQPEPRNSLHELWLMSSDGSGRRRIAGGLDPYGDLTWSPDGRYVTVSVLGPELAVVRISDGSVTRIARAVDATWSPDGSMIAWSNGALVSDWGVFTSRPDGTERRQIGRGFSPAWSPRGDHVAFLGGRRASQIFLADARSGREPRQLTRGKRPVTHLAWSRDGRRLAFMRYSRDQYELSLGDVWVIDLRSAGEQQRSRPLPYAHGPSWSPDGHWLAVPAGGRVPLRIVSTTGMLRARSSDEWPWRFPTGRANWLSNGRLLIATTVRTDDREIVLLDLANGARRALTANRTADFDPASSPDGRQIVYAALRGGRAHLYLARTDGRGERPIETGDVAVGGSPEWSPTGGEIAFVGARGRVYGIYIVPASGGQGRLLVRHGREPAWSPDGKLLAYQRLAGIEVITRRGTGRRAVGGFREPTWSPDGSTIAFQKPAAYDRNAIYVMNADDGSDVRLVAEHGLNPAWSPHSSKLVFTTGTAIWTVNADGTGLKLLVSGRGANEHPHWVPS